MKIFRILFNWIYRISGNYYFTEYSELPNKIEKKEIGIADNFKNNWVLIIQCPCGCGDLIYLNTLKAETPYWEVRHSIKGISIYPSVWRTKKCKSHFWIKNGKLKWVGSYFLLLISYQLFLAPITIDDISSFFIFYAT